jgi:hypothetical protein
MVRLTRKTKGKGKEEHGLGKGKPTSHAKDYEAVLAYLKGVGKG